MTTVTTATTPSATTVTGYTQLGLEIHSRLYRNASGVLHFTLRERLRYDPEDDADYYICKGGETLAEIAVAMYQDLVPNPADLWEVLQEYQEVPIADPSAPLEAGLEIALPSPSWITDVAYGESLMEDPELD